MSRKKTLAEVVSDFQKAHGEKYDYSLAAYDGAHTPIKIICPVHGIFEQPPTQHYRSGCKECALDESSKRYRLPHKECVRRLTEKYNGRYDYSKLEYTNLHNDVTVICKIHGPFTVCLDTHLRRGSNCPECLKETPNTGYYQTNFDRNEELANTIGNFYVIKLVGNNETFYKVGITKNNVTTRYHHSGTPGYKRQTILEVPMKLCEAYKYEQFCRSTLEKYIPKIKFAGYTECLVDWPYLDFQKLQETFNKDV